MKTLDQIKKDTRDAMEVANSVRREADLHVGVIQDLTTRVRFALHDHQHISIAEAEAGWIAATGILRELATQATIASRSCECAATSLRTYRIARGELDAALIDTDGEVTS